MLIKAGPHCVVDYWSGPVCFGTRTPLYLFTQLALEIGAGNAIEQDMERVGGNIDVVQARLSYTSQNVPSIYIRPWRGFFLSLKLYI